MAWRGSVWRWCVAALCGLAAVAPLLAAGAASQPATAPANEVAKAETVVSGDFEHIWHYELFRVGKSDIEVNQIVLALVLFVAGLGISRVASKFVGHRLLRRNRLHANAAFAVERLLFYGMLGCVALVSMEAVNIPITAFALVGGALAVAVGFGTQDIFNNFISGVILMFEGDIRIGDLIDVDGAIVRVEEIGGRCTRVKRGDGVDTLVPNSFLLQNKVVNWTLSDKRVRTSVVVVAPGDRPAERVSALLRDAAGQQPRILADPAPAVLLNDVAGNVLTFEVVFWIEIRSANDPTIIRSDLRRAIDRHFRESGQAK